MNAKIPELGTIILNCQSIRNSDVLASRLKEFYCISFKIQWNLDLSFFKETEKTNDECEQTINPDNYYTM